MGLLRKLFPPERQRVMRVATPRNAVARDATTIMQQRGWRRTGDTYEGPFATPYGTWHGRITAAGDIFRCAIKDPPIDAINRHPKRACFSQDSKGWWRVNLAINPIDGDVNSIIVYVERVLIESLRLSGKT